MKKILKFVFLILFTFILCSVVVSEQNIKKIPITTEYRGIATFVSHNGSQNVQCYKCKYRTKVSCRGYGYCLGCHAWRRYDIPIKIEGDAHYSTYKCKHGHTLLVSLTTEDIK